MRRLGGFALVAMAVACSELRSAQPASGDAGPNPASTRDGGSNAVTDDGGPSSTGAKTRPPCPAPCQPEHVSTMANLGALEVDSLRVYFAGANGGVFACAKDGCKPGEPLKLGDGKTTRLAVANERVLWGEADRLVACAVTGCDGSPAVVSPGQTGIDEVTTDGTTIVWHAHVDTDDVLRTCPAKDCSAATTRDVVIANAIRSGIGIGAGHVFWTDLQNELRYCPLDAPPCANVQTLGPGSQDAVARGDRIYWVLEQSVVTCPLAGCGGVPTKIGTTSSPHLPRIDDHDVYWREMVDDTIVRCPIGGCTGAPEVVASSVDGLYYGGLVLDGDYVYWTQKDGVWRRHK